MPGAAQPADASLALRSFAFTTSFQLTVSPLAVLYQCFILYQCFTLAKCSPDTAQRDIKDLVERGALVQNEAGGAQHELSAARLIESDDAYR